MNYKGIDVKSLKKFIIIRLLLNNSNHISISTNIFPSYYKLIFI